MRVRGWAVATLAAAGILLAACRAEAQYFGQNKVQYELYDWRSITSDHFEVYFYPGSDSLAMRTLDLAEKTNAEFSKRLGHRLSKRIPIILYGSHNDFAQTNVTPELIDGGTGGFTELLRDRVVVPFTGSYEDFRHVLVHELVHAFQFDILYNNTGMSLLSGQGFFQMPLWFAEGMAEYFSLGMEPNAEMWCRDGTIAGYIPPLDYMGGYPVYKFGQSAIQYLHVRFGPERFRDLLKRARQMRNFDRAFERTYGMPTSRFDQQWRQWLRRTYWPEVARRDDPDDFGKRLTDHRRDQSNLNLMPAVSPQGDRIAYFSDRRQYTDLYLMSAFDGKVLRRVLRGERNVQFEAWPLFRGSIAWSPDGTKLATTAKSAGHDHLYVVDAGSGAVTKSFSLPCDALSYPAWSPVSDSLVVTGVLHGRSDLWLVDVGTGAIQRLTDDTWDEREPSWSPDGRRIVFSSDRLAPVVLRPDPVTGGYGRYGLFELNLDGGAVDSLLDTAGDDHNPVWSPDGRKLAFLSDRGGAMNLYLLDTTTHDVTQLTDVLGGLQSISWSRLNDRLVFSAFDRGGWDIFAVQEPVGSEAVLRRLQRDAGAAVLSAEAVSRPAARDTSTAPALGALAVSWPDSVTVPDTSAAPPRLGRRTPLPSVAGEPPGAAPQVGYAPALGELVPPPRDMVPPDTTAAAPERTPLLESGGAFALSDSVLGQRPRGYRWKLAPEAANGQVVAATGYGFAGTTSILFSDFLGDRNLYVATDLFPGSIEETNALAIYSYLPRRWDWGAGAFHFKNYYESRVTTLGEQLTSAQLFSERNFGALFQLSYPFDRFRRLDTQLTQFWVERTFFNEVVPGYFERGPREFRSVTSPSFSLVGDNSLSSYYGPVNGSRYNVTFSPAFRITSNSLEYRTLTADYRRYWDLTAGYTWAVRGLAAGSWGRDPQAFRLGGFSTLRGFRDFDIVGSRALMVSQELRFPFIQQLGVVGPVPLGSFNLKGALFTDAGMVWNEGDPLRFTVVDERGRHLASPLLSFGVGIRSFVWFALVKLDVGWRTDLHDVARPRWHLSLGPEF
ncbi:MAG: PD40 domain-containing protein [Candidatus Eisenbacteria bacterium]|nr:PD40 domain-containing protein [Candidatus Eisenbacteria bacterium]